MTATIQAPSKERHRFTYLRGLRFFVYFFTDSRGLPRQVLTLLERLVSLDPRTRPTAEKVVKANPSSPAAWAQLIQARWDTAKGSDYSASTGTFTAAGKTELNK